MMVYKLFILLVATLFCSPKMQAQFRGGVRGGMNLSSVYNKFDGEGVDGANPLLGFHLGGVVEYSLCRSVAIQSDAQFIRNGGERHFPGTWPQTQAVPPYAVTTTVDQLQLLLLAKYKTKPATVRYFATMGPYFGYGLSAKITSSLSGFREVNLYTDANSINRFDFGLGAGLGVEFNKLFVSISYQLGLLNLDRTDRYYAKINSSLLSFGYFF